MSILEIIRQLFQWTPFLLEGFLWNLLIAATAMALGTSFGIPLAIAQQTKNQAVSKGARLLSDSFNQLSALAAVFYCAILLPHEIDWPGGDTAIQFPLWLKGAIALSILPAAFTAQNLGPALAHWRRKERSAALLFIPAWGLNALIVVIASSTTALVGVSELLGRSNKVIAASQSTDLMFPMYLYISLFFLVFYLFFSRALKALRIRLQRPPRPGATPEGLQKPT